MRYFDEMLTKWGFEDGAATPPYVELYREAYVLAINALAEKENSKVRAFTFDRPGMHNSCLILFAHVDDVTKAGIPAESLSCLPDNHQEHLGKTEVKIDSAMEAAIDAARDMNIDDYIVITADFARTALLIDLSEGK